jgi:hypothetical protein
MTRLDWALVIFAGMMSAGSFGGLVIAVVRSRLIA